VTKKKAARRILIVAAEIRAALDESDEDCPDWTDQLVLIADQLSPE